MAFARIDGILLHYRLVGPSGAPALAFANSLGTDARIWDTVIECLSDRYRIFSYDKRGHGLSDSPDGDYSLDDHVADLASLLDYLDVDTTALAGVSVGGLIAQGFALAHPERVSALILCATAPRMGDRETWNGRIAAAREEGMSALVDPVMERWFSPRFHRERPDELAGWRNLFLRADPAGYARSCATLRDSDLSDRIGAISAPALVIAGDHDRSTPIDLVRACAAAIAGARFEVIAGAGHIPPIEEPAVLARLIDDFLEELGHG